jgi:hypothetical protein
MKALKPISSYTREGKDTKLEAGEAIFKGDINEGTIIYEDDFYVIKVVEDSAQLKKEKR